MEDRKSRYRIENVSANRNLQEETIIILIYLSLYDQRKSKFVHSSGVLKLNV